MCTSERDGNGQTGFYQPFQSGSRAQSGARLARLPSGTQHGHDLDFRFELDLDLDVEMKSHQRRAEEVGESGGSQ